MATPKKQISIKPALREIESLIQQLQGVHVESNVEHRRTQALMVLEGVSQILKACCAAPKKAEDYESFGFPIGG
jgi:hypothetical protein